ncbi:MAG: hypothetical protein AB7F41_14145 [Methylocystis sp.]|uniref:hypothetical protein n=1 Tax=Methylocystis sp. TaxID=1911079 RepID=UPI003D128FD3
MSNFKYLLSVAVIVASFAGAAQASPYFPFIAAGSGESTGAPFEHCWWQSAPSRPYRRCVAIPAPPTHHATRHHPGSSPYAN